jgi:hypothetical protein
LLISTSTPPACPYILTFSACLLIHLQGFPSQNKLAAGWICLPPRPHSCVECAVLSLTTPASSILMASPPMSPQPLPRSHVCCCSPQVSYVAGAPEQDSNDEVPHSLSACHFPPSAFCPCSPPTSDDEVPIPHPPPLLLFALNLPRRLAPVADTLSSMDTTNLLLLLMNGSGSHPVTFKSLSSLYRETTPHNLHR